MVKFKKASTCKKNPIKGLVSLIDSLVQDMGDWQKKTNPALVAKSKKKLTMIVKYISHT